jgi:hypothetical protein
MNLLNKLENQIREFKELDFTGLFRKSKWSYCLECQTHYEKGADARVDANMKCGLCAYSLGGNGGYMKKDDILRAEAELERAMEEQEEDGFPFKHD